MPSKRDLPQPTMLDAAGAIVYRAMMEIAGIRVGKVVVYDPLTNTADVQPVRLREIYGQPQPEQLASKAPVCWWRFGGMVIQGDLEVGDQVLIVNLQRDFAAWWTSGLVGPSATERMHDLADVVILPWIQSLVPDSTLHGGPTLKVPTTFRLGRVDGTAGITMWPSKPATPLSLTVEIEGGPAGIKLGKTAVEPGVKATTFVALMDAAIAAAVAAAAPIVPPNGDAGTASWVAFQAAWVAAKATILTGKVLLE